MTPGRLLDISFVYIFSDDNDMMPSSHRPVNDISLFISKAND